MEALISSKYPSCITTPQQAYEIIGHIFRQIRRKSLWTLSESKTKLNLSQALNTISSEAYTIVDPRQIFHYAIQSRSSGVI